MRAVDLIEPPQQVLGRLVDVVAARVVGKVVGQWRSSEFLLKNIDLVEEENDTRAHKPPRIDYRVK